jgi:hypothetical protein
MADGPTSETRFQAWGEAVYALKRDTNPKSGLVVLFQITDAHRDWASWYYFNTDAALDMEIMGATHDVLGESSRAGSHFVTKKPMRVDELCGTDSPAFRRAVVQKGHQTYGEDVISLSVFINHAPGMHDSVPGSHPIHLYIKSKGDTSALDDLKPTFGWVNATGIYEKFNFNFPYDNKHAKLRSFEKTLRDGSSWVMLQ